MGKRYSATRIYTLTSPPLKYGIVEVDDDGTILEIIDTGGIPKEMERMEYHNGIIVPGFVITHSHFELIQLKGNTTEGVACGMPPGWLLRDITPLPCTGKDSLASDQLLSVLDELVTIQMNFPDIETGELLTRVCLDGAKALGMESILGSIEVGKRPGLVLIKGIDFSSYRLTRSSKAVRLV